MKYQNLANYLKEKLSLHLVPVAFAKVDTQPPGVKEFSGNAPSACTFWRRAETEVFYASSEKHSNCPIGAMTMGFPLQQDTMNNLQMLVTKMCECNYLKEQEAAKIPTLTKGGEGIVYGPLSNFPIKPDAVILWLTASKQMLLNEAMDCSDWTKVENYNLTGRPGCAAIPLAINNGKISYSLGCIGMRTFTNVDDNFFLTVVPESVLKDLEEKIDSLISANQIMQEFYVSHKQNFETA